MTAAIPNPTVTPISPVVSQNPSLAPRDLPITQQIVETPDVASLRDELPPPLSTTRPQDEIELDNESFVDIRTITQDSEDTPQEATTNFTPIDFNNATQAFERANNLVPGTQLASPQNDPTSRDEGPVRSTIDTETNVQTSAVDIRQSRDSTGIPTRDELLERSQDRDDNNQATVTPQTAAGNLTSTVSIVI